MKTTYVEEDLVEIHALLMMTVQATTIADLLPRKDYSGRCAHLLKDSNQIARRIMSARITLYALLIALRS